MTPTEKLFVYLHSVIRLRSPNFAGLPLLPKKWLPSTPYSRNAYNSFLLWILDLDLSDAAFIVDVGANHGDFSRAAHRLFPSARAWLFEPLPRMQKHLRAIIDREQKDWRLFSCALGRQTGSFPLFIDECDDGIGSLIGFSGKYLAANPAARPSRQIDCEVRILDEVAAENKIDRIDLLKIDVEGAEFDVLDGAAMMLARTAAVIVEVSLVRSSRVENPLAQMIQRLSAAGFDVVKVLPSLFDPADQWKPQEFNILARRS